MKDDRAYLLHIRDAVEELLRYRDEGRVAFDESYRTRLAAERLLGIIGEAAARLSPETKSAMATVPWKKIIGMRNILIHGYFSIDQEIIWNVIDKELHPLGDAIRDYLDSNL